MAVNENNYVGFGPTSGGDAGTKHTINHLPESAEWEEGVYQIETNDYVVGGANGVSNLSHQQLTNRTAYLKAKVEELKRQLDETEPDSEDYQSILAEIKKLDISSLEQRVNHLERHDMNTRLIMQMAGMDPDGYDGMITEPFTDGAPTIDQTVVDVTSIVSGDDSVDVTDATSLVVGAHYQLTDGENIEEVQIKKINEGGGGVHRVIFEQDVQNQYKNGKAKLYRSSIAIINGRAYGGGNTRTDEWTPNESFTGSNTQVEVTASVNYSNGSAFSFSGASLDENGRIVVGGPAVGAAFVSTGGRVGDWVRVNNEGDSYNV